MALVARTMEAYPYVFHPITVLGVGIILLIHYEWTEQGGDRSELYRHIGGFLGAGSLALIPTIVFFVITGAGVLESTKGNSWQMDALVAVGLFIGGGLTWYIWKRNDWGSYVPDAMEALLAVTVPYAALSPFWNVSGHVIIALMPTLYLVLVDRKFWPLLLVPIVMVPNRIYLEAHTWAQTIGGFVLATVIVMGVYWLQTERPSARVSESVAR